MQQALRSLFKSPGFTIVAVLTIAIGIGANTILFSVFDSVVLSPLELPRPERLVRPWIDDTDSTFAAPAASWPKYVHYRDHATSFEGMAGSTFHGATLTNAGDAEQLNGLSVTSNFLAVHRLRLERGRDFTTEDDAIGGPSTVIISHELWKNRFGGRDSILGETIELNGVPTTVIGVAAPRLPFPYNQVQYLIPRPDENAGIPLPQVQAGGAIYLQITARLRDGVSITAADAELRALSIAYNEEHAAQMDANSHHRLRTYADELVGGVRPTFNLLFAACVVVLLVACANIASLFLGRLSARHKEIAVRLSLGATRSAIVRLFLFESLVFSIIAGGLGVLLSIWGVRTVAAFAANQIPRADEIAFDTRALLFSFAAAAVTAVLVGLVPAWPASRTDLNDVMKDTGRSAGGGNAGRRFRAGLIVSEVALSVTLLVGAGLLVTSFWKLLSDDAGFRADGVAAAYVNLPANRYDTMARRIAFFQAVDAELTRQPNILHAAPIIGLPLSGFSPISPYSVGGQPVLPLPQRPLAGFRVAGVDYKDLVGLALKEGRWFQSTDIETAPPVVVINESFARRLFSGESALGRTILTGPNGDTVNEIVGVIADVKTNGLNQPAPDEFFYCASQRAYNNMAIAARTSGDPAALQSALRSAVASVDPAVAISFFQTMEQITINSLGVQRIAAWLIGCFAGIAFLLAIVGLYSVLSYNVTQRTAELGIRMALGALPGHILAVVLRQGLGLVALGVIAGLGIAALGTRLIASMLFGVDSLGPVIYATVAAAFLLVATAASLIPARRATRVDPLEALRSQ